MKEEEFWDNLADRLKHVALEPGIYEQHAIHEIGKISGKRVLDCGIGGGKGSMLLLKKGAKVFGFDISFPMLNLAKKKVGAGLASTLFQMRAEHLGFKDEKFDAVFGVHVLHHTYILESMPEIGRVLKKGGRGVFVENFGFNPLLNFSRTHIVGRFGIPRYGTTEEHPLTHRDLRIIKSHFKKIRLVVPNFLFMKLLARQVFRFKIKTVNSLCSLFDRWIYKGFPSLSHYSYTQLLVIEK